LNKNIKIEDNFLPQETFTRIQDIFLQGIHNQNENTFIPWKYRDVIDEKNDVDKFQFIHSFYSNSSHEQSQHANILNPIFELLQPISIFKIKANLLTRTPEIVENKLHVDMRDLTAEQTRQWTTSIFYINTNNGYTKFENGTKVESVANRMISFPTNMKHKGTSCTDEKIRVVINFNYYKQQCG